MINCPFPAPGVRASVIYKPDRICPPDQVLAENLSIFIRSFPAKRQTCDDAYSRVPRALSLRGLPVACAMERCVVGSQRFAMRPEVRPA